MTWQADEHYVEALRQAARIAGDLGKMGGLTPGSIGSGLRIAALQRQMDTLSTAMMILQCNDTEAAFAMRKGNDEQ